MTSHTILDQVLNRFALQSSRFRKFCFTRECERNGMALDRHRSNVFIAGVARSGSTALLNTLHASGKYASTTYNLMPFVLGPSLSCVIARIPKAPVGAIERRHGDTIQIDSESAEALDGVFWSTFLPTGNHLQPREVSQQTLHQYAMFIENILIHSNQDRYLCKMNQGITMLASLAPYFDRSVFLMPFRNPLQQASSLLRQHRNFARISRYEKKYLGWLGHHEFGATHLGFFDNQNESHPVLATDDLNYWLQQWKNSYRYLLRLTDLHSNILPLCYEQMTASPSFWNSLSSRLDGDFSGQHFVNRNDDRLKLPTDIDHSLYEACQSLYERLSEQARIRVC
jgi:hypothetical protein